MTTQTTQDDRSATEAPQIWIQGVDFTVCRRCGKPLIEERSVRAGIGARCAQEEAAEAAAAPAPIPLGRFGLGRKARRRRGGRR